MPDKLPEWVKTKEDYSKWKQEWEEGKHREESRPQKRNKGNSLKIFLIGAVIVAGFLYFIIPILSLPDYKVSKNGIGGVLPSAQQNNSLPPFNIMGRDIASVSILVSENTTEKEFENLVYGFQAARKLNTLSKLIPATTPGGSRGDYGIVWIFIFSERAWADIADLKRFINANIKQIDNKIFYADYVDHIKAVYYYTWSFEEGSIGYSDETNRSKYYKKLF